MIQGIQIEMTSEQLKAHMRGRADYHEQKVAFYREQVAKLSEGGLVVQNQSNDPVASLKHSAKNHQDRGALFKLMADYLVPNETYRLSENDLTRLELLDRYF